MPLRTSDLLSMSTPSTCICARLTLRIYGHEISRPLSEHSACGVGAADPERIAVQGDEGPRRVECYSRISTVPSVLVPQPY